MAGRHVYDTRQEGQEKAAILGFMLVECAEFTNFAVRPDGACHQWRKVPPRELSIDLVADERLGRV